MERGSRQVALQQLLTVAKAQGYLVFDDIIRCADENTLSIGDIDWLSNAVNMRNILIYDDAQDAAGQREADYEDYAQSDYDHTFLEIIRYYPETEPLIESIRQIVPPQRGEGRNLITQVREGNQHARQRMIEMYLRQAVKIAYQRATAFNLDLQETISDAVIGLINAVDRYNPSTAGSFNSFASFWIYQNITREQSTNNPNLYFPMHRKEGYYVVYPLLKRYGCLDCDEVMKCDKVIHMIRKQTNCNQKEAKEILSACLPCLSWELFEEENLDKDEFSISAEEALEEVDKKINAEFICSILDKIPERERYVLIERFGMNNGEEKTLEEVGGFLGVTRERVRQIEKTGIRRMKTYLKNTCL